MSHRLHKRELKELIGNVLKRHRATKAIKAFTGIHQFVRGARYHKRRFSGFATLTNSSKNHNDIRRIFTTIV